LCWVRIHCGIYKDFYNISNILYLNLPTPPFSFIPHYLLFVFVTVARYVGQARLKLTIVLSVPSRVLG
jgi:hypothetical protein